MARSVAEITVAREYWPMTIPTELIGDPAVEIPCPPLGAAELSAAEADGMAGRVQGTGRPGAPEAFLPGGRAPERGSLGVRHPERGRFPAHRQPPPQEAA